METEGAPERPWFLDELDYLRAWAELCLFSFTASWFFSPFVKAAVRAVLTDLAYPAATIARIDVITGVSLSALYQCVFFCVIVPLMFARNRASVPRTELLKTCMLVFVASLLCMWFVSAPILDLVRSVNSKYGLSADKGHSRVLYVSFALSVTYIYLAFRFFVSRMLVTRTSMMPEEEEQYVDVM